MSLLPVLPRVLEELVVRGQELQILRDSAGYQQFLDALGELRASNYLDILTSTDRDAILGLVGEARAIHKIRTLVDAQIEQGASIAAGLDAQVQTLRAREAAAQRTYAPHPPRRELRPFESASA